MKLAIVALAVLSTTTAVAGPLPKGRWKPLFTSGATWTLPITQAEEGSPSAIKVEITAVRKIGAASVATLEWTLVDEPEVLQEGTDLLPTHIAMTKKGIYAFDSSATDKSIAAAIKKKPTFTEPAKASVRKGRGRNAYASGFAFVPETNADVACFGFDTTDPELDMGGDATTSWVCFGPTDLVGVFTGYSAYGRDALPADKSPYTI